MADNFAMPNQQVPIGSQPAPHGYGKGEEFPVEMVKAVGKGIGAIGTGYEKRREEIAQGRKKHMEDAASAARGNPELLKGAMDFATRFMMANVNKDNVSELAAKHPDATKIKTSSKSASIKRSAVESPAVKPRVRKPAQTAGMRTPLEGGGYVSTRVPIARKADLPQIHERTVNGQNVAKPTAKPVAKTTTKATTAKPTSRATTPKPPAAKATPKTPASKAPSGAKPPAARKPRAK